jgi:hypothetical protein
VLMGARVILGSILVTQRISASEIFAALMVLSVVFLLNGLLMIGLWRGSRIAWAGATVLSVAGIVQFLQRRWPPDLGTIGLIPTLITLLCLAYSSARGWCRVRL